MYSGNQACVAYKTPPKMRSHGSRSCPQGDIGCWMRLLGKTIALVIAYNSPNGRVKVCWDMSKCLMTSEINDYYTFIVFKAILRATKAKNPPRRKRSGACFFLYCSSYCASCHIENGLDI